MSCDAQDDGVPRFLVDARTGVNVMNTLEYTCTDADADWASTFVPPCTGIQKFVLRCL